MATPFFFALLPAEEFLPLRKGRSLTVAGKVSNLLSPEGLGFGAIDMNRVGVSGLMPMGLMPMGKPTCKTLQVKLQPSQNRVWDRTGVREKPMSYLLEQLPAINRDR